MSDDVNDAMSFVPPLRPRFELDLGCDASAVLSKLDRAGACNRHRCLVWVHSPYAELRVLPGDEHLWSPRLSIATEQRETSVILHCRFGPSPSVWTGFMGAYAATTLLTLAATFFGISQWMLGKLPTAWWAALAGLVGLGTLYVGAVLAQRAGHDQMRLLRRELDLMIFECTIY